MSNCQSRRSAARLTPHLSIEPRAERPAKCTLREATARPVITPRRQAIGRDVPSRCLGPVAAICPIAHALVLSYGEESQVNSQQIWLSPVKGNRCKQTDGDGVGDGGSDGDGDGDGDGGGDR